MLINNFYNFISDKGEIMNVWNYIIHNSNNKIFTQNSEYAEKRSKQGNIVFCKRITNFYKH